MKTDDLIRALSTDTRLDARPTAALVAGVMLTTSAALAMLWLTLGFRDDLLPSMIAPVSALRYLLTGAVGLIGLRLALVLARPEGAGLARLWPLAAVGFAALGLLLWAYVSTPADGRQMALVGKTMVTCLVTIPLLSILPVTAILVALRQGATTTPALAGFVAGVAGSGLSAMVYATHCTEDSPLFYVTWYGLAMCGVALVSTLVGARVLRW